MDVLIGYRVKENFTKGLCFYQRKLSKAYTGSGLPARGTKIRVIPLLKELVIQFGHYTASPNPQPAAESGKKVYSFVVRVQ